MSDNLYPRLRDALGMETTKTAGTLPDPGPDSGHPASVDPGNMSVPSGDTITEDEKKSKQAKEKFAPESEGGAVQDKEAVTLNTETGKDGDELRSELKYESGIPDPGPDSSHPASVPTEKYASCENIADVASVMKEALTQITSKLASMAEADDVIETNADAGQGAPTVQPPAEGNGVVAPKTAELLGEIIPEGNDEDGVPYAQKFAQFVGSSIEPYVAEAVRRGENFAAYCKIAMQDPAAAEAMMAGPEAMGGDMGGMPPEAMGAEMGGMPPEAMGGEGGGGEADLMMALEQIAAELGVSVEEVIAMLQEEQGAGGMEGGAPPEAMGAEMGEEAPPEAGPEPAAEPEASESGDESEDPTPKESASPGKA